MKVIIEADGGSRGNPGIAGSGSVVYADDHKTELRAISYVAGKTTNNVAEYHSLLNGLTAAEELGASEVQVFMDSKLVVEQMSGRWKIKHPDMKELAIKAQKVARSFDKVTYTWVPRSNNTRADELANKAMDAAAKGAPIGILQDTSKTTPAKDVEVTGDTAKAESQATKPAGVGETCPTSWNGATTKATRLILLRHGQTEMSAKRQYSGRSNPSLSELGQKQAEAAAQRLGARGGIDAIVASPLKRTMETAQAAADKLGLTVEQMDELIELDFGSWEGLTFAEAMEQDPELHAKWLSDTSVCPPNGETLQQAYRRAKKARDLIVDKHAGQNVLVVSHVTPIKAFLRMALDANAGFFHRMHLDLASLSIAEFYADGPTSVRLVNDTSHLTS